MDGISNEKLHEILPIGHGREYRRGVEVNGEYNPNNNERIEIG
jgi:hypothetical protein